MRRRNPTAFSTDPFSLPESGLQNLASKRQWALSREKSFDSVTLPRNMRPASVALSRTTRCGARPAVSNIWTRPSQKHSAFSHIIAMQKRTFECGNVATRSFSSRPSPAMVAAKTP